MAEKTIADIIDKPNEGLSFEERARKFEAEIKPIGKKWGIAPAAGLQQTPQALVAVPLLQDTWEKKV